MPGSTVLGGDRHRDPRPLPGGRLPKQALAWYASTVTDADCSPRDQLRAHRPGRSGDRRCPRGRRRHQRRFRRAGRHRRHLRAAPGRGPALRVPLLRRPRRRRGQGDDRRDRRPARPPRRRGQQRRRFALRARPRSRSAKFNRKIIELNLLGAAVGFAARQRRDAEPAAAADRSSTSASVSGRRPTPGTARLRRGQGRRGKPHADAGGRVGARRSG